MNRLLTVFLSMAISLAVLTGAPGIAVFAEDPVLNKGREVTTEPGKMKISLHGEFDEKDWVGVYKNGETADPAAGGITSIVWWYAGTSGREVELPTDHEDVFYNRSDEFIIDGVIVPGDYTVMVLANDGYEFKEGFGPYYVTVPSSVVEGEDADKVPSELLFFNDDEHEDLFRRFNAINDFYYDSDKHCFVADTAQSLDPYIELFFSDHMTLGFMKTLTADDAKVISIGVRIDPTAGNELEFYYQTDKHPGLSETQKVMADYSDTDGYQFVNIDLRQAPNWEGNLFDCRYDVFRSSNKDCEVEIYYIGFFKTMAGANEYGEAWLANGGGANAPAIDGSPESTADIPETAGPEETVDPGVLATEVPAETQTPEAISSTDDPPAESSGKKGCGGFVSGAVSIAFLGAACAACAACASRKRKNH